MRCRINSIAHVSMIDTQQAQIYITVLILEERLKYIHITRTPPQFTLEGRRFE